MGWGGVGGWGGRREMGWGGGIEVWGAGLRWKDEKRANSFEWRDPENVPLLQPQRLWWASKLPPR